MPVSDSAAFASVKPLLHERRVDFLELMSWWEIKRYFNRNGHTVVLKHKADVVVVHPVGRCWRTATMAMPLTLTVTRTQHQALLVQLLLTFTVTGDLTSAFGDVWFAGFAEGFQ